MGDGDKNMTIFEPDSEFECTCKPNDEVRCPYCIEYLEYIYYNYIPIEGEI